MSRPRQGRRLVFQDVSDSAQLSAMTRAIDQIMEGDGLDLKRTRSRTPFSSGIEEKDIEDRVQ